MSLNRINVMGRIGKDLELRRTQSGKAVTSFPIAVDRDGKDAGTDWFDVVAWERTAEFAAQYCAKGRKVVVDGRLQARDWTDKDGNTRRAVEIIANSVYLPTTSLRRDTSHTAPHQAARASLARSRMTETSRFDGGCSMRYDVLIYDSDNILNAADPSGNLIRIIGLTQSEADDIADILTQHGVSIGLLPYKE